MPVESKYVVCPLDVHHVILKTRIQTHLAKCEKQHDMTKKSKCPYNLTHIVDTVVFPHHLQTCLDGRSVHHYTYNTGHSLSTGILQLEEIIQHQEKFDFGEENWDSKKIGPGYDPNKHIDEKMIIRQLSVASKKERKDFRLAERKRHQHDSDISSYDSKLSPYIAETKSPSNYTLRFPKSQSKAMSLKSLSVGEIKKELLRASQLSIPSTLTVLEDVDALDVQQLTKKKSNEKDLDKIVDDLNKIKFNDHKDDVDEKIKDKYVQNSSRLKRLAPNFSNIDDCK